MLAVIGSIALDTLLLPSGEYKERLGGAAVYFALSARFFTESAIIGVVGTDFPKDYFALLQSFSISTENVQIKNGRTFRWTAQYDGTLLRTLSTEPGVFERFYPTLQGWKGRHLFLANIHPSLQREALEEAKPKHAIADTMDYWIKKEREELLLLLKELDTLFLNREEARMLTAEQNLIVAAKKIICMGPKRVVIKKGEDGAMMVTPDSIFFCPPFPTESVKDPTGCGDSFAGACMGYLLTKMEWDEKEWRYGCILGAAAASFCIEEVGVEGLLKISKEDLLKRAEYILQSVCV